MRSEAERLAERVTRLERLVLALLDDNLDRNGKGAEYYFEYDEYTNNSIDQERKVMRKDMDRSCHTGQV